MNKLARNFLISTAALCMAAATLDDPLMNFINNKRSIDADVKNSKNTLDQIQDIKQNGYQELSDLEEGSPEYNQAVIMSTRMASHAKKTIADGEPTDSTQITMQEAYEMYQETLVQNEQKIQEDYDVASKAKPGFSKPLEYIGTP